MFFTKSNWKTLDNDVCEAVLSILNGEGMNSFLNSSFITLIPKKHNADTVSDFQHISLCNILYKFVSKTITNRLKPFMHSILSSNQIAFILGRLIIDNIMVAHELLYSLKKNKKGKVDKMPVKLDISKVYDRVEWSYIEAILKTLRFKEQGIKLVTSYIFTVNNSVLVNGKPERQFFSSSGLETLCLLISFLCVLKGLTPCLTIQSI